MGVDVNRVFFPEQDHGFFGSYNGDDYFNLMLYELQIPDQALSYPHFLIVDQ
jgi:hypothetical protein